MSDADERLRSLERRWRETGAVADEARWLLERVRLGLTSEPALALAAQLGYAGAREARGETKSAIANLNKWGQAIERFESEELSTRTVVAAAKHVFPSAERFAEYFDRERQARVRADVARAGELIRGSLPSEGRDECERLAEEFARHEDALEAPPGSNPYAALDPVEFDPRFFPRFAAAFAVMTVRFAVVACARSARYSRDGLVTDALYTASRAAAYTAGRAGPGPEHEMGLRVAILREIAPWLLHLGGPTNDS